jgi:hypothetical protein
MNLMLITRSFRAMVTQPWEQTSSAWHSAVAMMAAAQPVPGTDASADGINAAGWATILWIVVLVAVFIIIVAVAGIGLMGRRRTRE